MPKQAPNNTIDAELDYIAGSNTMHVLSSYTGGGTNTDDPYATVVSHSLASQAMVAGDFTKADGPSGNGRQLTVAAKSGVPVSGAGSQTATHVALVNSTDSSVRYVTTCTSQTLTNGNTVNIPSWVISVADPT